MKAIRMHTPGGPELLVYEEVPKPAPSDGDALVRVDACAITPTELSWSETYTTRDGADRLPTIPGYEVSGWSRRSVTASPPQEWERPSSGSPTSTAMEQRPNTFSSTRTIWRESPPR